MPKFSPLVAAGWPVIPLARDGKKTPLVSGYHGADHQVADVETVRGWAKRYPDCNPGIVLPDNVIGFDVDGPSHGVNGLEAIEAFESKFGPLPAGGHIFHGRDEKGKPSPYGTRLYRIPDDMLDVYTPGHVVGNLNKVTGKPGVDVIAPWIRYNVAPGAVHSSGETYEWSLGGTLPEPDSLPVLSRAQVEAVLKRQSKPIRGAERPRTAKERAGDLLAQTRALAALDEGQTLLIEGEERGWQRGNGFFVLACALVRLAKNRQKAKAAFVKAAAPYDDAERQWDNAEAAVDAETSELLADSPDDEAYSCAALVAPYDFAGEYLARRYTDHDGVLTLRFADLRFWLWAGTHFRPLLPEEMQARLSRELNGAVETTPDGEHRPIHIKRQHKSELLSAVQDRTLVSTHGAGVLLDCSGGVPFRNGWLNVKTGVLEPLTPRRDIRWIVPGNYNPDAPEPTEWLQFLKSIGYTSDTEEYRLLRQWMGYLLSGYTSQQKAMMLVGPPRAGKGTILKVCEAMLGEGSVGIDLSAFSTNFGLSPTIGKSLAFVDDARFEIKTDKALVRRILSMVAEGTMTIDRKHKDPVSVRSTARLMLATNEVPAIIEASEALASRFLFLKFSESFLDREDLGLVGRVLGDLPGIVKWALVGLDDLTEHGRFAETHSGKEMKREMGEISNPIRLFIEEECVFDPQGFLSTDDLHGQFAVWAEHRRFYVPPPTIFARDLNAAYADSILTRGQKRVGKKMIRGFHGLKWAR